jgi:hypothetical protein
LSTGPTNLFADGGPAAAAAPAPASGVAPGSGPSLDTVLGSMGPGVADPDDNTERQTTGQGRGGFKFTMGKRPNWL